MRRLGRILGVLLLGLVVTLALLVVFPPANLLKDRIARIAGDAIGRTVTIGGARLAFRPDIDLVLSDVTVSNPEGMTEGQFLRAGGVKAKIRIWPLIQGETELASLVLVKPDFNLQQDAEGNGNWSFARNAPSGAVALAPSGAASPGLVLPHTVTFEDGSVRYASARTGTSVAVDDVTGNATIDRASGLTRVVGRFAYRREPLTFDATIADINTAADERPTALKANIEGRHIKASVEGEALSSELTTAFAGELSASSVSLLELARWLGAEVNVAGEPLRSSLAGRIRATTGNVQLIATNVVVNQTSATVNGNLDLSGPRARFEGEVASERIDVARVLGVARSQAATVRALAPSPAAEGMDLVPESPWDSLLAEIEAIERAGTAGAAPRAAAPQADLSAAAKPVWSEQPIGFGALKVVDLNITLLAKEIAYGGLDLKNGVVKVALANGVLDAKVEKLDVGAGTAVGTVAIDSVASPPRLGLDLTMTGVAAEPIINEIAGKPLISGTSNAEISVKAVGQNPNQLSTTVEGKAKFRVGKGALRGYEIRGFDFWEMLTNWKTILKFDLAKRTPFERLDAQYDIKKGIMSSSPGLDVGGGQVEINSKGDVNLPRKRITQKLRVTVLPPPTTFSLPVLISGDWAQPSIGIDWGGWFSGIGPSGDLRSLTPGAAPPPPEVQAAIRRLLSSDVDPGVLSEEGRNVLRALLPPETGTDTPPEGGTQ